MKLKIVKSLIMILAVIASATIVGSQALFTDTAESINNTFVSGNTDIKLYYHNAGGEIVYNVGTGVNNAVVVEKPVGGNGNLEAAALKYTTGAEGATYNVGAGDIYNLEAGAGTTGDWAVTNYWWDGLSSPMDHTNVYPGWNNIDDPVDPADTTPDIISVGNASTLPVNLTLTLADETRNVDETYTDALGNTYTLEPEDGTLPGGDRIDPLTDIGWESWAAHAKTYNYSLADIIDTTVERIDNTDTTIAGLSTTGKFSAIGNAPITLGVLQPNEVAWVRLSYSIPTTNDMNGDGVDDSNNYQNLYFDYLATFNAANRP